MRDLVWFIPCCISSTKNSAWHIDIHIFCPTAYASLHNPSKMANLGHTFPFYVGRKPIFPLDITLAVIIAIFLTAVVTFIIILPGIRGKMVRNKPSPGDPSPREILASR